MAQLYTLLFGTSKKRMKPIMIDVLHKCENYKEQREKTKGSKAGRGWHKIEVAPIGSTPWKQKTCTVGGNRCDSVPRVGHGPSGWIGSNGFNPHT